MSIFIILICSKCFNRTDADSLAGREHEPEINLELLRKVIIGTPHIAGYSADGKANAEIIVGVIKPTRFDPKPDKRLFIYRIADEAYIRPLWLGSRVAQPLEDFRIIREETPTRIRTLERERSGNFLVAEYIWRGFGLDFKRYLKREVKKQEAIHILKH